MSRNLTLSLRIAAITGAALMLISGDNLFAQTAPKRTVEITYNLTVSEIPQAAQRVRIWIPQPMTDEHQKLNEVNIASQQSYQVIEEPQFGNKFLLFDFNDINGAGTSEIGFSVKFNVTRYAFSSLSEHGTIMSASRDKPVLYLAANRLIPIDGKVADEAKQVAGHTQDPLSQARLLYDHIVETLRYDKSGTGWGRGDAVYACDVRKGNCTDFHSLFIGQARSLGIPARFIMGLPLPEDKTEGPIAGYHCWGEFYLRDKGWCPIDASEANKFPQKKEQFFCGLDENRVAFTLGRDIKLPGSNSEPLNYVIYPYVEIDGKIHSSVKTSFSFKDCPP
jgi:transglutaminase-like putative cysteine protease